MMVKDFKQFSAPNPLIRLSDDIPIGLSIQDQFIFSNSEKGLKVFSSRCTHLGCKITMIDQGEIVCPCHGSRYNENGKPIKGPSIKRLTELTYEFDKENNELVIRQA